MPEAREPTVTGNGFEVVLAEKGEAEFHLFSPSAPASVQSLVTFAKDPVTGTAAVLMGTLHYRDDLKARLSSVRFQNDAGLALASFLQHGVTGLTWLEGEFALAVFDAQERCLFALRDPLGSYPLYWVCHHHTVRVSTHLRLLAQRLPETSVNLDFLASFLMFPYAGVELATEQTAFTGSQRILPGTLLRLHPCHPVTRQWSWDWRSRIQPLPDITPEAASEQFLYLFRQAVKERIQFGKIASHLSGGMDSSSVACIARDFLAATPDKLIALSLVYQMPSLAGESQYIQRVVEQGGALEFQAIAGDAALDFHWFSEGIPGHDEPYSGLFHLAMERVLVEVAHQLGVTTILSGGGAELILEGNRSYLADWVYRGRAQEALQEARQWAIARNVSLWSVVRESILEPLVPPWLQEGLYPLLHRGYGRWPHLGLWQIPPWIRPEFAHQYCLWHKALAGMGQLKHYPVERAFQDLGLQAAAGNWASWYVAAPLDIRISKPFLDPRLMLYCLGLPRTFREVPGTPKPLLTMAMRGILPEPIRTRRLKVSFNEVYWRGLGQHLPYLEQMVAETSLNDWGIFDKDRLIQAMRQHAIGIGDVRSGSRIGRLLAAIAWFNLCCGYQLLTKRLVGLLNSDIGLTPGSDSDALYDNESC
jgi:asparagine synthase (glutamine-hydrolysing)